MGLVAVERDPVPILEAEDLYEGAVLEASPNTKILSLTRPEKSDGLKVIFRTPHNLSINDTVRIFGKMKELTITFKNPHVTSWKWLKGLEGVSYEIRGPLLSVTQGKHYIHGFRKMLAQKIESSGTRYGDISRPSLSVTQPVSTRILKPCSYKPGHLMSLQYRARTSAS